MHCRDARSRSENLRTWHVYTLHDPREPGVIRYVGWTIDPKKRLYKHISDAKLGRDQTYCGNWKRSLLRDGVRPILTVIETGKGDGWKEAEVRWVAHFQGRRLTNLTEGGEGTLGYKHRRKWHHTPEQKAKIGAAHRGRKHSSEAKANMREAHLGKKHTPEQTAKIAAANKGS